MKYVSGIGLVLPGLLLLLAALAGPARAETFCPPGQLPQFIHGFAFLKSQLGEVMGEPLECEHYDEAGNAYQRTTTGSAFYRRETNTPMFTAGQQSWAWTPNGLEQQPAGPALPVPGPAPLPLRVMTYNVLYGAGATPEWEQVAASGRPFSYPGNRLPQIEALIQTVSPDVLAVQEAAGWDTGEPPVVQQVADDLELPHYFLARSQSKLHLALFSRFEIVEAENLSDPVGNIGALRVKLALPGGQFLTVFAVHLDPFSPATRAQELQTLTGLMAPYLASPALLMGDLNMNCMTESATCREYQILSQAGWRQVAVSDWVIDQIWAAPLLANSAQEITFRAGLFDISDHYPVAAVIEVPPPG